MDSINANPNLVTVFSKRGNKAEPVSYLQIAYTKEIEQRLIKFINALSSQIGKHGEMTQYTITEPIEEIVELPHGDTATLDCISNIKKYTSTVIMIICLHATTFKTHKRFWFKLATLKSL